MPAVDPETETEKRENEMQQGDEVAKLAPRSCVKQETEVSDLCHQDGGMENRREHLMAQRGLRVSQRARSEGCVEGAGRRDKDNERADNTQEKIQ